MSELKEDTTFWPQQVRHHFVVDDDENALVDLEVLVAQLHEVLPQAAERLPDLLVVVLEAAPAQERRYVGLKVVDNH